MDKEKETMVKKIEYLKETICHCENNLQYIKRLQALKYWLLKLDVLLDNPMIIFIESISIQIRDILSLIEYVYQLQITNMEINLLINF